MVTKLGFLHYNVNQAVFQEQTETIIVLVHVNDCTIAAISQSLINDFKKTIMKHVKIINLGEFHWFLGIEIKQDRDCHTIHLYQQSYIESILPPYNLDEVKLTSTPMEPGLQLPMSQVPKMTLEYAQMRDIPYREAVSSIMYATLGTHPDIAFMVQTISRYCTNLDLHTGRQSNRFLMLR